MRYIGTKTSTLPFLVDLVAREAPDATSICDCFAGTCSVARRFKAAGLRVFTGDLMTLSRRFQHATVALNGQPAFPGLEAAGEVPEGERPIHLRVLERLSSLEGRPGYVTTQFSPASAARRMFFTEANALRIDAMRSLIALWSDSGLLGPCEEDYLLTSLIAAADAVANTAGTYYAYLKAWDRKARKPISLRPIALDDNGHQNVCRQVDAREFAAQAQADILYLDPPYNSRDYAGYYHLPETLARGDAPEAIGMSGAPRDRRVARSDFCRPAMAAAAFQRLVQDSVAPRILMHYAVDGLISHEEIMDTLSAVGPTRHHKLSVRSYATDRVAARGRAEHRVYWCERGAAR